MKKVCVVTGTRAEYGILRPVMRAIDASGALTLQVIAAGMHLDDEHGHTVDEIVKDGFAVDATVEMSPEKDTPPEMGRAVGRGTLRFIDVIEKLSPDVVLVLGDRTEAFAAAIAGVFCGKCVAHIHGGGRRRGGFDESMRHAITKLAHVHFAATQESCTRICRMGEDPAHVHIVGAPGLDDRFDLEFVNSEELGRKLGVDFSRQVIVVVQHPVSTRPDDSADEMRETLEAVVSFDLPVVIIYPNNDAGSKRSINVIREYESRPFVKVFVNLPRNEFLNLLWCASVLVGNSSCGIIESPSFRLPVVNIGDRQEGRGCPANMINVPHERDEIADAIANALDDEKFKRRFVGIANPYGTGDASRWIADILGELVIDEHLLQKEFVDA